MPARRACLKAPTVGPKLAILKELYWLATTGTTSAPAIGMSTLPRPRNGWPKASTPASVRSVAGPVEGGRGGGGEGGAGGRPRLGRGGRWGGGWRGGEARRRRGQRRRPRPGRGRQ